MKQYIFTVIVAIASVASTYAQQSNTEDRTARHQQQMVQQNKDTSKFEELVFRFETAYEDRDIISTAMIQQQLTDWMQTRLKADKADFSDSQYEKWVTSIDEFSKYTFKYNDDNHKKDEMTQQIPQSFLNVIAAK